MVYVKHWIKLLFVSVLMEPILESLFFSSVEDKVFSLWPTSSYGSGIGGLRVGFNDLGLDFKSGKCGF